MTTTHNLAKQKYGANDEFFVIYRQKVSGAYVSMFKRHDSHKSPPRVTETPSYVTMGEKFLKKGTKHRSSCRNYAIDRKDSEE